MRVIRLRGTIGNDVALELHSQFTLVRGLDPWRRAWLIDVLGRLAGGRGLPATGELEAHGIRFDLDDDSLAVLGLDQHLGAVVTAADLPGHDPAVDNAVRQRSEATRRRDELAGELAVRRAELTTTLAERDATSQTLEELSRGEGDARLAIAAAGADRSRLEFELQSAREERALYEDHLAESVADRESAAEARNQAAHRVAAGQFRRQEAIEEATRSAAALESARSLLRPPADTLLEVTMARERLAAAERAAAEADPDGGDSPLSQRLAALERRRVELARLDTATGEGGHSAVASALDNLMDVSSDTPPLVAALALADSWRDLHQQISALEAGVSPAEREAEGRLAAAEQAVQEAESDFNQPILTPEQITKVEAAHTAVLDGQDRSEGRFRGSRARKRLEELRGDERRVLERLGFSTYTGYMMSSSSHDDGSANQAALDTARANRTNEEDLLEALPGAGDRHRRRVELLERRDAVAPRVADLLGHEPTGPEAEDELRKLREPLSSDAAALEVLAARLADVGVDVGPGPYERDDLVLLGRAYLAEEHRAQVQRADILEALPALDEAIDQLRGVRSLGETEVPEGPPLPELAEPVNSAGGAGVAEASEADAEALTLREARWAEVESARSAVLDAEVAGTRHCSLLDEIEELEREFAERSAAETRAAADLADAEEILTSTLGARTDAAVTMVAEAEVALARARAAEDEVSAHITAQQGSSGAEPLLAAAEGRLTAAEGALAAAAAAEQTTAGVLAGAEAALAVAVMAEGVAVAAVATMDRSVLTEETNWVLLSRLARLRSVGPGGSVPLVLDDPFAMLDDSEVANVLDDLVRLCGAIQVVVVSDRKAIAEWAAGIGPDRVLVHTG